jgi:hypothetical protein
LSSSVEVEMTNDEVERGLKAWDRAIEVQQHFNDIEMRVRNYALTLLVAVLGASGLALQDDNQAVAVMLLLGGLVAWAAFYLMDRHWYHPLLKGAVDHAKELEQKLAPHVPGVGLATAIANASPSVLRKADGVKRKTDWTLHSPRKMDIFYGLFGLVLIIIFVLVLFGVGTNNPSTRSSSLATPSPAVRPSS